MNKRSTNFTSKKREAHGVEYTYWGMRRVFARLGVEEKGAPSQVAQAERVFECLQERIEGHVYGSMAAK
jgi:hypothetical protein